MKRKKISVTLTPAILRAAAAHFGHIGGKIGGKVKSPARARASRENGKLGGRPPKKKTVPTS